MHGQDAVRLVGPHRVGQFLEDRRSDESTTGPNLRRSRAVIAASGFELSTIHRTRQTPSAASVIESGANESGS